MRPERRVKPGMDGGLTAASVVSPLHHLRTGKILSKRWGPPHQSQEFCALLSITYYSSARPRWYCGFGGKNLKPEPDQPTGDTATVTRKTPQPVPPEAEPDVHKEKPKK